VSLWQRARFYVSPDIYDTSNAAVIRVVERIVLEEIKQNL